MSRQEKRFTWKGNGIWKGNDMLVQAHAIYYDLGKAK